MAIWREGNCHHREIAMPPSSGSPPLPAALGLTSPMHRPTISHTKSYFPPYNPIPGREWTRGTQPRASHGKTPGRGCLARIRGPGEGCSRGQGAATGCPWAGAALGLDFGADSRPCMHNTPELHARPGDATWRAILRRQRTVSVRKSKFEAKNLGDCWNFSR